MPGKNIQLANQFAKDYDEQVLKNKWIGPDILYNLLQEYIREGQNLLDLGIGTGASSLPFYKAGLNITGIDGSTEMLKICRAKKFTNKLIPLDLENNPLPFEKESFDIVISNALLHLIHPLESLFKDALLILKADGVFSFTYEDSDDTSGYNQIEPGVWEKKTESGVFTFKHEKTYIRNLLNRNRFKKIKENRFLAFYNKELKKEFYFTAIVAQKQI
ncbi:MAG: class I SAM-dependent methyltransferase [Mariniphaga sp.]|nr:class I SAM-dependent methyltransferase [Mariniphaga sp.]